MPKHQSPHTPSQPHQVHADGTSLGQLDPEEVLHIFRETGAIVFRGFPTDFTNLHRFMARLATGFIVDPSPERIASEDFTQIQTVVPGNGAIAPHFEYGHWPFRPQVLWFFCTQPASKGGETLLASASEVLRNLPDKTRRFAQDHDVLYRAKLPRQMVQVFLESMGKKEDGSIHSLDDLSALDNGLGRFTYALDHMLTTHYQAPMVATPQHGGEQAFIADIDPQAHDHSVAWLADGRPIPNAFHDEVKTAIKSRSHAHSWQAHDVLMVDNHRFLHGRNAFQGRRSVFATSARNLKTSARTV